MADHKDLQELTLQALFSDRREKYVIPIYQRNYAWEKPQIEQLVEDIWDYTFLKQDSLKDEEGIDEFSKTLYFIGNLIVFNRAQESGEIVYETIDGQQRLTTLTILMAVLSQEFKQDGVLASPILSFDSRPQSEETIRHIHRAEGRLDLRKSGKKLSNHMLDAYDFIYKKIKELEKTPNTSISEFTDYLLTKVVLLRVSVPEKTDLNHYFEIMNNRGEQLEKHEILKAQLLNHLQVDENASEEEKQEALADTQAFQAIWESCEEMEKYIQYGFKPDFREKLFTKDWNKFLPRRFEDISELYLNRLESKDSDKDEDDENLMIILESGKYPIMEIDSQKEKEEAPERFNSIINFSNFLLHVLRIQVNNYDNPDGFDDSKVPLDDKRLLPTFEGEADSLVYSKEDNEWPSNNKKEFAKLFAFNLLKAKFYYDQFILKKELNKEEWSLKTLGTINDGKAKYTNSFRSENGVNKNDEILMLLSMFHVSYPSRLYKHWLNGVLNFLMKSEEISPQNYKEFLRKFAEKILFDRYLMPNKSELDYHSIIYLNNDVINKNPKYENLNRGTEVENFVFNYLDYLLWRKKSPGFEKFQFAFRDSVEHHYPQNPINKEDKLIPSTLLPTGVDDFGNLCILQRGKNSKLSNLMPRGKEDHYRDKTIDSLKQKLMFSEKEIWDEKAIANNRKEMFNLFEDVKNNRFYVLEEKSELKEFNN